MDAQFNYRDYKGPAMGTRSQQGNWNLKLKQFLSKFRECLANLLKSSQKEYPDASLPSGYDDFALIFKNLCFFVWFTAKQI